MKKITLFLAPFLGLISLPAFAHHPMSGAVPTAIWHGIVSGFAHPIIGLDHFAFILAVGILAAFQKNRALLPLGFIAGSFFGCLLFLSQIAIPASEFLIASSVLLIGIAAMYGKNLATIPTVALIAGAGILHGYAYGSGIIGAESSPLIAYLICFSLGQFAISYGVAYFMQKFSQMRLPSAVGARLAGAMIAGIGLTFMIENIESVIFA